MTPRRPTVRVLLAVGTLLGLGALTVALIRELRLAEREQNALASLNDRFGSLPHFYCFTDDPTAGCLETQIGNYFPRWLRARIGNRVFDHVQNAEIHHGHIEANDLHDVAILRSLRKLSLYDCEIEECALFELATLPRLECLELAQTNVTDSGVALVSASGSIRWLNLSGTKIGDAALAFLQNLRSLKRLDITMTNNISAAAFERFKRARPDVDVDVDETALIGYRRPGY